MTCSICTPMHDVISDATAAAPVPCSARRLNKGLAVQGFLGSFPTARPDQGSSMKQGFKLAVPGGPEKNQISVILCIYIYKQPAKINRNTFKYGPNNVDSTES